MEHETEAHGREDESRTESALKGATIGGFVGAIVGARGGPVGAGIGGLVGGATGYALGYASPMEGDVELGADREPRDPIHIQVGEGAADDEGMDPGEHADRDPDLDEEDLPDVETADDEDETGGTHSEEAGTDVRDEDDEE